MAGSEATLGKTLGHGDWQTPGHSVFQQLHEQISLISISTTLLRQTTISPHLRLMIHRNSNYYVFMIYPVTTTTTNASLWSLKQLSCPYDPYCYSHYHVSTIYTVTATIMSLCSISYCYNNYYVITIYTITATITSLRSIPLQQLSCPYKLYCYSTYYVLWSITL